jgi:signal peptidase II
MRKNLFWFLVTFLVIIIDQLTKLLALHYLSYGQPVAMLPLVNFTLAQNSGAAFSLLANASGWQNWFFSILAIVVSVIMTRWLLKLPASQKWTAFGLALILGGAVSNLLDRFFYGRVTDFIDFYLKNWHFATFNVADSAISIGLIILILAWKEKKK